MPTGAPLLRVEDLGKCMTVTTEAVGTATPPASGAPMASYRPLRAGRAVAAAVHKRDSGHPSSVDAAAAAVVPATKDPCPRWPPPPRPKSAGSPTPTAACTAHRSGGDTGGSRKAATPQVPRCSWCWERGGRAPPPMAARSQSLRGRHGPYSPMAPTGWRPFTSRQRSSLGPW